MRRRTLILVALLSCVAVSRADHVKVDVAVDHASAKPGDTVSVAVTLTVDPHWHVYWRNPGDTGAPPKLRWKTPAVSEAAFDFPVPRRLDVGGGLTAFGYEDHVTLLTQVTVPAGSTGAAKFVGTLSVVVCDKECVLERHPVLVRVPVGETKLADIDRFVAWRSDVPAMAGVESRAAFSPDGRDGRLEYELPPGRTAVDFFPPKVDGLEFGNPETVETAGRVLYRLPFKVLPGPAIDVRAAGVVVTRDPNGDTSATSVLYHLMTGSPPPAAPNP